MGLVWTGDLHADGAEPVEETGGKEGVRSRPETLAMLVVPVRNGHEIDPHGWPLGDGSVRWRRLAGATRRL
jgi:hypothetical protein